MDEGKAMVDKKEKHLVIEDALEGLRSALDGLDILRCKIQGVPQEDKSKETDRTDPSLLEFLNTTPEEINRISEEINKSVDSIREMLSFG